MVFLSFAVYKGENFFFFHLVQIKGRRQSNSCRGWGVTMSFFLGQVGVTMLVNDYNFCKPSIV